MTGDEGVRTEMPQWLLSSLANRGPTRVHDGCARAVNVSRGSVVVVDSMFVGSDAPHDEGIFALVLEVYDAPIPGQVPAAVKVMAMSEIIDGATGSDALIQSETSGLPYDLIARPDVVAEVLIAQISGQVGSVDAHTVDELVAARSGGGTELLDLGPVSDRHDARALLRRADILRFEALCADGVGVVDRGERDLVEAAALRNAGRRALGRIVASTTVAAPTEGLSIPPWAKSMGLARDVEQVWQAAQQRALADAEAPAADGRGAWLPDPPSAGPPADEVESWIDEMGAVGHRSIRLLRSRAESGPYRFFTASGFPVQVLIEGIDDDA